MLSGNSSKQKISLEDVNTKLSMRDNDTLIKQSHESLVTVTAILENPIISMVALYAGCLP